MVLTPPNSESASEEVSLFADGQECASSTDTRVSGGSPSSCCRSPRGPGAPGKKLLQALQHQTDGLEAEETDKHDSEQPTHAEAAVPAEVVISQAGAACCCCHPERHRCGQHGGGCSAPRHEPSAERISSSGSRCCCRTHKCSSWRSSCSAVQREHHSPPHFGKWQKILWKKQPHPDCYVDETFLNTLMRNANLTRYMYSDLCKSTVVLTQHLSCILIFLLVYRMIVKRSLAASTLVVFDVVSLPLGYALRWSLQPAPRAARQVLQSAIIVFGVLRILAPVLQTLTQSFSDDTVISLTSICLLIHIPLNDYSYVYRNPETIDEPLGRLMSLNVALFANVLLASRLSTSTEVFAFLFFGIE
ncbi:LOW QUALITY PROTEIN: phosphatidylinositol N-acetylglucosaminyltransferase subunit, putative [Eimeria mitis]|uniref:Phosphatidylinositol N-acetylglucosaminyltransferase subunit, putative n=1 Tax=Eimeria mitis TaxID=44415 RepID=U6K1Q0_9EIME|nr:LOW QUALITY PROTEIN: phosphatidylinositol N-acetylglucosaminyltransferase subunit, putative [Eimeria mitis]CDJ30861.1 phosphatidylinositol N-acetylglucosaminyltransferase subunit, putative [Eimeria mitis]